MKIKCKYSSGKDLRQYEFSTLKKEEWGRFGTTEYSEFGLLKIGKEYLVMGILLGEGVLNYLIDDGGVVAAYPCLLFEVIDNQINSNWVFNAFKNGDRNFPFVEAIWGYKELVFDNTHYERLVEGEEEEVRIYFKHKIQLEQYYLKKLSQ